MKQGLVWEAQFHLQKTEYHHQSNYDFKYRIEEANLLKPEISWDCCDADLWYTYAIKNILKIHIVMFCFYQTLLFKPYHYEAFYGLLRHFQNQKNIKMAWNIISMVEPIDFYYQHVLRESTKIFSLSRNKDQNQFDYSKNSFRIKGSRTCRPLEPIQNPHLNLKKCQLTKTLLWRRYLITHDHHAEALKNI